MAWHCVGTSVIGKSHIDSGIECQDFHSYRISDDRLWAALVVCDGAGSAKRSAESANLVANFFSESLLKLAQVLNQKAPGEWINDYVIQSILDIRAKLRDAAQSDTLAQFHTTLVASLVGPHGGFAIHIGDGAIFTGSLKEDKITQKINLDDGLFISTPHNGEYANETFFITESSWIKNIRITPISKCDWLMLCSDGGASLTLNHDCTALRPEFFVPLVTAIKKESPSSRDEFLYKAVATDKTWTLTNDDKTLLFCFSDAVLSSQNDFSVNPVENKKMTPTQAPANTTNTTLPNQADNSPQAQSGTAANSHHINGSNQKNLYKYLRYLVLLMIACTLVAFVYLGAQLDFVKKHFNPNTEENQKLNKPDDEGQEKVEPKNESKKSTPELPSEQIKKSIKNKDKLQKT